MSDEQESSSAGSHYLICRSTDVKVDEYSIWRLDFSCKELLQRVGAGSGAKLDPQHQLISIGNYLLEWGPIAVPDYAGVFPYRLIEFDPGKQDPLGLQSAKLVQKGIWPKTKFWGTRPDFGNPDGAAKAYDKGEKLILLPLGTFLLNVIPTTGRGTFRLFSFDPLSSDPLYQFPNWTYGSFLKIEFGHELIPLGNYVLDRVPETRKFCLWSFDPMKPSPLLPFKNGRWKDIDATHRLVPVGEYVLDWDMGKATYRLWKFDPESADPLGKVVRSGDMPDSFGMATTLTGHQVSCPINEKRASVPGTIEFMRSRIKHVVYYMLENRSFDHVCGWLYEKGADEIIFVGDDKGPFSGASESMYNIDPDAKDKRKVYLQKYPNTTTPLPSDPYHDMTDTLRQFFFKNPNGYADRKKPDMGGFVWNNGVRDVMFTFTPEHLPILNGLAKAFSVSDAWFCSMPGATDANRAFALTGSALGQLNNFQNGPQWEDWPHIPSRGSIWKVLWANGFSSWKIYNSIEWQPSPGVKGHPLSYHLFLEGQIPKVDQNLGQYIGGLDEFLTDARAGKLPKFSFVEPVWIASAKPATSYHPYGGGSTAAGEIALNELYEALMKGPAWNDTLLIITFDEHGGLFDHVPPPYAANPWPCDEADGFRYDIMGVRVPTILVSPWIEKHTVFRSPTSTAYDSTSILATLLHWFGIPKARWCLGARAQNAPTFEGVFLRETARSDQPRFTPQHTAAPPLELKDMEIGELHHLMVPRLVHAMLARKKTGRKSSEVAHKILSEATNLESLTEMMKDLAQEVS